MTLDRNVLIVAGKSGKQAKKLITVAFFPSHSSSVQVHPRRRLSFLMDSSLRSIFRGGVGMEMQSFHGKVSGVFFVTADTLLSGLFVSEKYISGSW
ncbi:hypothetical protein BGX21_006510, partial [Mortierella sp. AD011]